MVRLAAGWVKIISVATLALVAIVGSAVIWRLLDRDPEISAPDVVTPFALLGMLRCEGIPISATFD